MPEQQPSESRILLRPVSQEDASFLWKVANDPSLREILCDGPSDIGVWRDAIDMWRKDPDEEVLVIVRCGDDTPMGWVGVNGLLSGDRVSWVKMIALLPEFWKQGYGSETIREVKRRLFRRGCSRIRLWTDQCNTPAQDCYRRNGFVVIERKTAAVGTRNVIRERVLMECRQ